MAETCVELRGRFLFHFSTSVFQLKLMTLNSSQIRTTLSPLTPSSDDKQIDASETDRQTGRQRDRLMSCRCVPFYHNWPKHQ